MTSLRLRQLMSLMKCLFLLLFSQPIITYAQDFVFDFGEDVKTMLVITEFTSSNQVTFDEANVLFGYGPTHLGNPPMLQVRLRDYQENTLEEFNEWYPYLGEEFGPDGNAQIIDTIAPGFFIFSFYPDLETIELIDIPTQDSLITINLQPTIEAFCLDNRTDEDCTTNLSLSLAQPVNTVREGSILTLNFNIDNNLSESNPAHAPRILMPLPRGFGFDRSTAANCEVVDGTLQCDLAVIPPGESRQVSITLAVGDAVPDDLTEQTITMRAQLRNLAGEDPDLSNNDVEFTVPLVAAAGSGSGSAAAGLSIQKFGGVDGTQIKWVILVNNQGSATAANIVITDEFDPNLRIDRLEGDKGEWDQQGQLVNWSIDSLSAGESAQLTIWTTPLIDSLQFTNNAELNATGLTQPLSVTANSVTQLPVTGETPLWRFVVVSAVGLLAAFLLSWFLKLKVRL